MAARDLRWQVVDGAAQPEQPALFDVPEREIGTGEFRGLEFLHVPRPDSRIASTGVRHHTRDAP